MGRLLIVSNRLPVTVVRKKGKSNFQPSVGGLATGLASVSKRYSTLWVGWSGIEMNSEEKILEARMRSEGMYPVNLSKSEVNGYYHGFCNKTIWPLFHNFPQYAIYNEKWWDAYKKVNEKFQAVVTEMAESDDIIWIHDYHLMLLPNLLREEVSEAKIGFFLHIPFPPFEMFRLLPWRRDLLEGLLGADLIGFHIYDYVQNFLQCIHRLLGYEHELGRLIVEDRIVKVDAFPMGIDYDKFESITSSPEVEEEVKRIRKRLGGRRIILSVDRLDYTKGIPLRLEAFDLFLDKYPEYVGKVTFVLKLVPSRTRVEHYVQLKKYVDELVGKINGKYGDIEWVPVQYIYRFLPLEKLIALYRAADIALITPLRDGMNLVAKEFIASKIDGKGALILSETTGAAFELVEAIIVNPNDKERVAEALKIALEMPEDEQINRNRTMQERLKRYNVEKWVEDFIQELDKIKEVQHEFSTKYLMRDANNLLKDYRDSSKRLLLLDYDGTLVPHADDPRKAEPDEELVGILTELSSDRRNTVVIVSGRDRKTLEGWFKNLNVDLVAEHGAAVRRGGEWRLVEGVDDWKESIRQVLELYVDRTPGSFIEEKEFSIVWHYRKANPELGRRRAAELESVLMSLIAGTDLNILKGDKVIEVRKAGVDKGRAALEWLSDDWEFVLAAGNDVTDEDLFSVLPENSYSIKIGFGPSRAKYYLRSVHELRSVLKKLQRL
ncbi:MAG: Trehalose-6-phosphate synthase [Candidatus Alkanophagales archaeon MCA70_species_1]|nr:Trehalose-6-phosphate synthase [Candidatus Alkanophaga volatiphilum]